MRRQWKVTLGIFGLLLLACAISLYTLAQKPIPAEITYGMSFNTLYANELGLDWQETYDAFLDDLGVRHLRLAAHWPMVEPRQDVYNFDELDYQVQRAEEVGATVVLAIGRRLPRWPECHVPEWAESLAWEEQQSEILALLELIIRRYQNSSAITYWQIENEPYLSAFAREHCTPLDETFLQAEIDFVRSLDPTRPILVTDSGNLGTWYRPYQKGDAFGTSVYVHFWNPELGQFRTVLPSWFYRVKDNLLQLRYGEKETMLIELSAEPWLVAPVTEVPLDVQFTRMNMEKFTDILAYAEGTRYEKQYLWGGEWWYWLKLQDEPAFWERGQALFSK